MNQADGETLLEPVGLALITIWLHNHSFTHPFVVCNQLKQSMLLGLDFAGFHKIGFDWTSTSGQVYLRYQGKPIIIGTANAFNISDDISKSINLTMAQSAHSINKVAIAMDARVLTQDKNESENMSIKDTKVKTNESEVQNGCDNVMLQMVKNMRIPPARIIILHTAKSQYFFRSKQAYRSYSKSTNINRIPYANDIRHGTTVGPYSTG